MNSLAIIRQFFSSSLTRYVAKSFISICFLVRLSSASTSGVDHVVVVLKQNIVVLILWLNFVVLHFILFHCCKELLLKCQRWLTLLLKPDRTPRRVMTSLVAMIADYMHF